MIWRHLADRGSPGTLSLNWFLCVCLLVVGSELRTLRKENLKSMLVSVIILAVAVGAYLTFGSQ